MDRQAGLSLLEALAAVGILAVVTVAVLPAFTGQLRSTERNIERTAAINAVQQRLEALRMEDPASMPTTGASAPQLISVGDRQFEVVTRYCDRPALCNANSRHVTVVATHEQRQVYDVETIYTRVF